MNNETLTRRAVSVAGAVVAVLVLWVLAGPVAGNGPSAEIRGEVQEVGAVPVAVAGLVAGLVGWALLALLERTVSRPGPVWTIIAGAVLVLSMTGPFGSAADTASTVVLAAMHLLVAAVLIPGLGLSARRR